MEVEKNLSRDVLILGGGISGLSLAYYGKKKGFSFCLLEKANRLGGVIQSVKEGDFLIERGPNSLLNTHSALEDMIQDLGLEGSLTFASPVSQNRFIVKNRSLVPMPLGPLSFLLTPLFSWRTKLGLMKEPFIPRGKKKESLAEFVKRRLGEEFLDYAVDPFVAGVYAASPYDLDFQFAFPKLYQLEQDYGSLIKGALQKRFTKRKKEEKIPKNKAKIFSFQKGLEELPKRLGEYLKEDIFLGVSLEKVEKKGNSLFSISGKTQEGERKIWEGKRLVLTIPGYAYSTIPWKFPPPGIMEKIPYAPMAMVFLGYAQKPSGHNLNGYGCLVPQKENRKILGILFNSSLFPGRAPKRGALLTVFFGGSRQPHLTDLDEDQLFQIAQEEVAQLLGFSTKADYISSWKVKQAIPQYDMNYSQRLKGIEEYEKMHRDIYLMGNFRGGISLSDCILKGRAWINGLEKARNEVKMFSKH